MNTLPAKELKRRGVAAFEDLLKSGPVTVLKNNHPVGVMVSPKDYQAFLRDDDRPQTKRFSVLDLLRQPARGKRSKKDIDAQVRKERLDWGD